MGVVKDVLRSIRHGVRGIFLPKGMYERIQAILRHSTCAYVEAHMRGGPRSRDPLRLTRFGYKSFSQNDEDGIIEEIFRRIGTSSRTFVEFGVEDGLQNNTLALLYGGWSGFWIEGSPEHHAKASANMRWFIDRGRLRIGGRFLTRDNIQAVFRELGVPQDLDFLSIDIDGNDYWIWEAIIDVKPRAVVVEYNGAFGKTAPWVMEYDERHRWDGSNHFGASLKALEILGRRKGYRLVGCNFTGINAFFVREDLVGDLFHAPFDAETHFEPPRYYLDFVGGHGNGPARPHVLIEDEA